MTERVVAEWRRRVAAEYRSASVTAQVLQLLIATGAPEPLIRTAIRIVGDELDHANLSHDVAVAAGGADEPAVLDVAVMAEPVAAEGPVATLLDAVLRDFCLGETFAVPLFAAMRAGTTHPVARDALDRVLRDEAVHRQFGWDVLDALIELDPDGVRARAKARLPRLLREFEAGYGTPRPSVPLTAEERAMGLLDLEEYVAIHHRTVAEDVVPRLVRRGIQVASP